jgi:hypothetical protein
MLLKINPFSILKKKIIFCVLFRYHRAPCIELAWRQTAGCYRESARPSILTFLGGNNHFYLHTLLVHHNPSGKPSERTCVSLHNSLLLLLLPRVCLFSIRFSSNENWTNYLFSSRIVAETQITFNRIDEINRERTWCLWFITMCWSESVSYVEQIWVISSTTLLREFLWNGIDAGTCATSWSSRRWFFVGRLLWWNISSFLRFLSRFLSFEA